MLTELNQLDLTNFHFIRADLLWLVILLIFILFGIKQVSKQESSWQKIISPHLLKFLMVSAENKSNKSSFWLTGMIALLMIIAVSGPSFREKKVPVFQTEDSRVILLDLSLSMDATDIKPSRIDRARFKIMDILEQTKEGTVGLIIYAGDAFVISPLTSDSNTIASMIPALSTGIMPVLGSRPDIAIKKAIQLLDNAKQSTGQIIWITDGIEKEFEEDVVDALSKNKHLLSVLAIGTEQGAPIPLPETAASNSGGFLKDNAGNIILPKLDSARLKSIVTQSNGQYVELTSNNEDIDFIMQLLAQHKELQANNDNDLNPNESDKRISRWIDDGYWLTWIIGLLYFLRLFKNQSSLRNNRIFSHSSAVLILLIGSSGISFDTQAGVWEDLWQTKDQQAQKAFVNKDYKTAASTFEDPNWKASAAYKSNDFGSAINGFSGKDADSLYNKGNALAKAQKFQEAITAYDESLVKNPNDEDTIFNKKLVEDLLKQQKKKEQEKKDQQEKDKKNQEKNDKKQSDSDSNSEKNKEDNNKKSDKEKQKEQQKQKEKEQQEKEQKEKEAEISKDQRDTNEKDQALKHWLERIPDDPGGLLRRKMYREYQRRGAEQKEKKVW